MLRDDRAAARALGVRGDIRIGGAAIDVFPKEPKANDEEFLSPLRGLDNVLLTPHIGGSTEEAQDRIGREVATRARAFDMMILSAGGNCIAGTLKSSWRPVQWQGEIWKQFLSVKR